MIGPFILTIKNARVVQTLDSATQRLNYYPADKYYKNQLRYSFSGQRFIRLIAVSTFLTTGARD